MSLLAKRADHGRTNWSWLFTLHMQLRTWGTGWRGVGRVPGTWVLKDKARGPRNVQVPDFLGRS